MNYGTSCVVPEDPWIGRCQYYAAYELLQHIYGNLKVTVIHSFIHSFIHIRLIEKVFRTQLNIRNTE